MRQFKSFLLMTFLCLSTNVAAHALNKNNALETIAFQDSLKWADYYYNIQRYQRAIDIYQKTIAEQPKDGQASILKKLALSKAALEQTEESVQYLEKYLMNDFNTAFLQHEGFDKIRTTPRFVSVTQSYLPKLGFWTFFYLSVSLIGFYIVVLLLINPKIDLYAKILIAGFVLIHSVFILHIAINLANYHYIYPHTYLMSSSFSFLYGPLLYFYLKRITGGYSFKALDFLHFTPTILLLIYIIPNHLLLTSDQKLHLMLDRTILVTEAKIAFELLFLTTTKAISLIIYGLFIRKIYLKSKRNETITVQSKKWQRNIYRIHFLYVLAYIVYGGMIILNNFSGVFFHGPTISMSIMVIFVGYSASMQPNLVSGVLSSSNKFLNKYKKSGLTRSLSNELKEQLLYQFAVEKIYKENNISLDMVAQKLNTTRHNTSQIINEHFEVSFHELVNIYRIKEAKQLLLENGFRNLSIIDVAYEVGYNNKVTFNKAFKKETQQTPSEYKRKVVDIPTHDSHV